MQPFWLVFIDAYLSEFSHRLGRFGREQLLATPFPRITLRGRAHPPTTEPAGEGGNHPGFVET